MKSRIISVNLPIKKMYFLTLLGSSNFLYLVIYKLICMSNLCNTCASFLIKSFNGWAAFAWGIKIWMTACQLVYQNHLCNEQIMYIKENLREKWKYLVYENCIRQVW